MAVKRSVSLYSYQQAFYLRELTFEQCVAEAAKTGATGIELIPEMHCPKQLRNPSDRFVAEWKEWMEKYNVKPVCMDIFRDYKMYKNRMDTIQEQLNAFETYCKFAVKLGFPIMRGMLSMPIWLIELYLPIAESYGVKLGIEQHAPASFKDKIIQDYLNLAEKKNTKFFGIIPDFSIFSIRASRVKVDKAVRMGAQRKIADYVCDSYEKRIPLMEVMENIKGMNPGKMDMLLVDAVYFDSHDDPQWFVPVLDKVFHFHGKVYDMNEACEEVSIDYESPIKMLKENNWDGYISTEYEGQRFFHDAECPVDPPSEIEQVRRHQVMLKRLIGE